jgi:hypothetical protein
MSATTYITNLRRIGGGAASRFVHWLVVSSLFVAVAAAQGDRVVVPVTLEFQDFPLGVVVVDLGQSLTINIDARNDAGQGVTWTCVGEPCTPLTTTSRWATFHASGITGTATITATSIRQPGITASLTVIVFLNAVPDLLCERMLLPHATAGRVFDTVLPGIGNT